MKNSFILLFFLIAGSTARSQSWIPVSVEGIPYNYDFQSVSVVNSEVVWAIADSLYGTISNVPANHHPIVLRSTDGGATWSSHRVAEAVGRFAWMIEGIDANTAIFTTNRFNANDNRPVFKTTNGGLSWQTIVPPNNFGRFIDSLF